MAAQINSDMDDKKWLKKAIDLAAENVARGGGPFACIIVKDNQIIAEGVNRVVVQHDPTAHAEVQAIRRACEQLESHQLDDCVLYTSCEPCPMCFGAIYWARPQRVVYAATKEQAARAGFDDDMIYDAIANRSEGSIRFTHEHLQNANAPFELWGNKADKKEY